jgi:dTDP-glucose pyrophosphorylase
MSAKKDIHPASLPAVTGEKSGGPKEIEDLVSPQDVTIKIAWERINRNANQVLFIVDAQKRILGSVSDGDVRRWVLGDNSLNEPVHKIMNRRPVTCQVSDSVKKIKATMVRHKVHCVPLLDSHGRLKRLVTWDALITDAKETEAKTVGSALGIPAVIIAGGFGTRLYPFTKILPKPLVPLGDKPIIEHIMNRFQRFGVDDFVFSLNYKASMIKAYFSESATQGIQYIQEEKPLGTAGSLALLKGKVKSEFFVSNCDVLIDADYGELLDFHRANGNGITMVCSMKNTRIPYGVVEISEGGALKSMREKPEFNHLVNTGMYVVSPEMLALIPDGQFLHFTDLIEKARGLGHKVGVYPITESAWVDIGQLEDYHAVLSKFPE